MRKKIKYETDNLLTIAKYSRTLITRKLQVIIIKWGKERLKRIHFCTYIYLIFFKL